MFNRSSREAWNLTYTCSIYMKGDRKACGIYRGRSVTCSVRKLYASLRTEPFLVKYVSNIPKEMLVEIYNKCLIEGREMRRG